MSDSTPFPVAVGESRSPSLRRWHVTVTPGGTHTHYEYLMDEDINDAQKILPSSVPRVNTPSSVSAWHRVQIGGREGITPSPGSYHGRRDARPSFLTRLIGLKAKDAGNGWGSASRCAEICSLFFFFFKERNLDSFNPLYLPASFFFFFLCAGPTLICHVAFPASQTNFLLAD